MAATVVPLTARRDGPSAVDLSRPKVVYITDDDIKSITRIGKASTGGCAIILNSSRRKIELFESPANVRAALQAVTTDPYTTDDFGSITAAGSVLTAATAAQLSRYVTRVTAATVNSNDSVMLPPPSTGKNVVVVINGSTTPLRVFPHSASAFIDGAASGAAELVPVGQRRHFATYPVTTAAASAIWKTALDKDNLS